MHGREQDLVAEHDMTDPDCPAMPGYRSRPDQE